MTSDEIYSKIQSVYKSNEKGKNFISHLIRAFFPIDKGSHLFGFEEGAENLEMKCCITGEKLYSKNDFFLLIKGQVNKNVFSERLILAAKQMTGDTVIEI
jgi:hypothetical protein